MTGSATRERTRQPETQRRPDLADGAVAARRMALSGLRGAHISIADVEVSTLRVVAALDHRDRGVGESVPAAAACPSPEFGTLRQLKDQRLLRPHRGPVGPSDAPVVRHMHALRGATCQDAADIVEAPHHNAPGVVCALQLLAVAAAKCPVPRILPDGQLDATAVAAYTRSWQRVEGWRLWERGGRAPSPWPPAVALSRERTIA